MKNYFITYLVTFLFITSAVLVTSLHSRITESECVTVGGNRVGVPCKFPFVYDMYDDLPYVPATMIRLFSTEKKFESCTDYNKKTGRKWCATKTTSNDRYVPGHWGECPDTYVCNTDEGSYQPWSSWSGWTECAGGRCGNSGLTNRTRQRKFFSRKIWNESTGEYLMQTQEDEKTCMTRDCPGWKYNKICQGDDIFRKDETFLISLLGDTKEKCEALCNAIPECNLAKFYSASYLRDIYKCIPKTGFKGHCEDRYKTPSYSSNYTSSLMFYVKDFTGLEESKNDSMNESRTWKWDALENGENNDCRLCVSTRDKKTWNYCRHDCKTIPAELKDMQVWMKLALQEDTLSNWLQSSEKSRKHFLNMFKKDKLMFSLMMNSDTNYDELDDWWQCWWLW